MQCGTAEQGLFRYDLISNTIKPNGALMCTHFKTSNVASMYNASIHFTQQKVIFYTNITTLDAFKAFLAQQYANGTAVEIVYELETEVIEDVDCSNKITQYDEQTTVYNRDNAEIEVSLTNNKAISEINEDFKSNEIQTIKNENGTAIKFSDGTMICLQNRAETGVGTYNETNKVRTYRWTFPVAFATEPVVTGNVNGGNSQSYTVMLNTAKSYVDIQTKCLGLNGTITTCDRTAQCMAAGRWK